MNNSFCVFNETELDILLNPSKLRFSYDKSCIGPLFGSGADEITQDLGTAETGVDMATYLGYLRDCFQGLDLKEIEIAVRRAPLKVRQLLSTDLHDYTLPEDYLSTTLANIFVRTGDAIDILVITCREVEDVLYFKTVLTTEQGVRMQSINCLVFRINRA